MLDQGPHQHPTASRERAAAKERRASALVSRNVLVDGQRTSIRLEPEAWLALRDIARREGCTIHDIATLVAMKKKDPTTLTGAIRMFAMLYFVAATTEDGHAKAGHGDFARMRRRAGIID